MGSSISPSIVDCWEEQEQEQLVGLHMARMYSGEEVAAICADLQSIFQATTDEVREEAAENVNDAYNEGVRDGQM